jgi:uncharacterized protein (DUF433 family)
MMTQLFVSNPNVLDGSPCFAGTNVLVQALFDYLYEGESTGDPIVQSVRTFLADFPDVSTEQVTCAMEERDMH